MTRRIAISLSDELYRRMERVRRQRRVPRSRIVQEAVGEYVKRTDEAALEEAYFDGYRRIPDGDDPDFIAIERAGIKSLRQLKD